MVELWIAWMLSDWAEEGLSTKLRGLYNTSEMKMKTLFLWHCSLLEHYLTCPNRFQQAFRRKHFTSGKIQKAYLLPCEVNCTRNTDDQKTNDDGGDGHPLGIPPETPGSFDVSIVVAIQRLEDTREKLVVTDNPQGKACPSQADLITSSSSRKPSLG